MAIAEEVFKVGGQRSRSYVYKCVNGVGVHLFEFNRNVCILAAEESPSTSCGTTEGWRVPLLLVQQQVCQWWKCTMSAGNGGTVAWGDIPYVVARQNKPPKTCKNRVVLVDLPKMCKYLLIKSSMYGYNTIIQQCGRYQYYMYARQKN